MKNYIRAEELAEKALCLAQKKGFGTETRTIGDRLDAIRFQRRLTVSSEIDQGVEGQCETSGSSDTGLRPDTSSSSSINTDTQSDFES